VSGNVAYSACQAEAIRAGAQLGTSRRSTDHVGCAAAPVLKQPGVGNRRIVCCPDDVQTMLLEERKPVFHDARIIS